MDREYSLRNAIIFNPTGKKHNAIASPASVTEIRQQKEYFHFNFEKLAKEGEVYKIRKEGDEDIIQGLVAFKASAGILDCANMETNNINKSPLLLNGGVGKASVALCCKISFDLGFDGYITFEAKTKLGNYYKRLGAFYTTGLRMAMDTNAAQKLIDIYF